MKKAIIARTIDSSRIREMGSRNWDLVPKPSEAKNKRNKFKKQAPMMSGMAHKRYKTPKQIWNSEVEKKLDYNLLPTMSIQEKISKLSLD